MTTDSIAQKLVRSIKNNDELLTKLKYTSVLDMRSDPLPVEISYYAKKLFAHKPLLNDANRKTLQTAIIIAIEKGKLRRAKLLMSCLVPICPHGLSHKFYRNMIVSAIIYGRTDIFKYIVRDLCKNSIARYELKIYKVATTCERTEILDHMLKNYDYKMQNPPKSSRQNISLPTELYERAANQQSYHMINYFYSKGVNVICHEIAGIITHNDFLFAENFDIIRYLVNIGFSIDQTKYWSLSMKLVSGSDNLTVGHKITLFEYFYNYLNRHQKNIIADLTINALATNAAENLTKKKNDNKKLITYMAKIINQRQKLIQSRTKQNLLMYALKPRSLRIQYTIFF
jgi:hypothetical protein